MVNSVIVAALGAYGQVHHGTPGYGRDVDSSLLFSCCLHDVSVLISSLCLGSFTSQLLSCLMWCLLLSAVEGTATE